jgi:hypothetical protein
VIVVADPRAAVLAEVARLAEHGGLSMRPAELPAGAPLGPPTEAALPHEPGTLGGLDIGADARRLARILVPGALLALVGMLVLAGVVTAVALVAGVLLAIMVAIVGLFGLAGTGMVVAWRLSRRSLSRKEISASWQSRQSWLGPLAQSRERRLVFVAVDTVARIARSDAWASDYTDDHRIRLDLATELDEIDDQAYQLAALRHRLGEQPDEQHAAALDQSWDAIVDRVSALSAYADRLAALASERGIRADDDAAARLIAGTVRDELAAEQLRDLTTATDVTNYGTSHRNAT